MQHAGAFPTEDRRLDLSRPHDAHIDARLRTAPVLWLGSTRPDGRPHLVPVWFLWDGSSVLVFSLPRTQKLRNIKHNPQVMLALDAAERGNDILLLEGHATVLGHAVRATLPAFVAKYDGLRRWSAEEWADRFSQAIRIVPTRLIAWIARPEGVQLRTLAF